MSYKESSKTNKSKPRGRPFAKGNKKGKPTDKVLASPGLESNITRENVNGEEDRTVIPFHITEQLMTSPKEELKEVLANSIETTSLIKDDSKELETIESIEFKNGENTLEIRFSRKHNRMFRIQTILNNQIEIRPVTYTGSSTGYTFWNILKGILKK